MLMRPSIRLSSTTGRALTKLLSVMLLATGCTEPTETAGLDPEPTPASDLTDTLAISPQNPQVVAGQQVVFTAPSQTVNGTPTSGAVTWTSTGGTIDTNGVFMASTEGAYTVTGSRGTKKGRTKVTVGASGRAITSITVSPHVIGLQPSASFNFAATGTLSDGSSVPVATIWTATGGSIDTSGTYRAGPTAGTFRVVATGTGTTLADTSVVTISAAAPTLQAIDLAPATVSLAPGGSQQFSASGRMSDGSTSTVSVTWSATGGTISQGGAYTAGQATGTYRVVASNGTLADTSAVVIATPPSSVTLTAVVLTPASVTLASGNAQQFSAVGRMSDGSTSSIPLSWTATGGSVSASGAYVAGSTAGTYRIIAASGSLADTSLITISLPAPTLVGVALTPKMVTLAGGTAQQFSAVGRMSDGSTSAIPLTWTGTGGTVSSSGFYTASQTAGTFRVVASSGSFADTATVTVTVRSLTSLSVTPKVVSVTAGAGQQFAVAALWSDGTTTLPPISWTATGGSIGSSGYYTAGATAGTYRVIASGGGKADTASVTVTAVAPTLQSISVSPASSSLATGAAQQFTATGRMTDGSTTGVSVTWTATGGGISASGLYTAGSTPGTYQVVAQQQGGSLAATVGITITSPVPVPGDAIDLTVRRVDGGSGDVLVSNAIPLAPGRLVPGNLGRVRLLVGGVEQPVYVEALKGKHADGSLRSVLVQFRASLGTSPVAGQLSTSQARTTPDRAKEAVPLRAAAVALPSSPAYLVATQLVGPTAVAAGSPFPQYESMFTQYSDVQWAAEGANWAGNYYDRAMIHYAFWVRTGDPKYWDRATAIAVDYRTNYLEPNGYGASPHWAQMEGMALHYWLTGDERSRVAVPGFMARQGGFSPAQMADPNFQYNEGRIMQRVMLGALLAWMLEDTSKDWATMVRGYVNAAIGLQQADGSYRWLNACYLTKNFMLALQNDALMKVHTWFEADPRIVQTVKRAIDWQWSTQWRAGESPASFNYLSGACSTPDTGGNASPTPDLTLFYPAQWGWVYRQTGDATYRTRGDQLFQAGVAGAYPRGSKQFNQAYYNSFTYLGYR
jgi:hypothetical protein